MSPLGPPTRPASPPFVVFEAVFLGSLFIFPLTLGSVPLWGFSLGVWFLSGAFAVWWYGGGMNERVPSTALDPWIGLYAVFFLLSLFFSKLPYFSLIELFKLTAVLCAYWATRYLCRSRPETYRLAECFALLGGLLSGIGLLQLVGGMDHGWWARPDLVSSMYVNHNHFAGFLVLVLPVSLGLAIAERSRAKKILFIFLCTLMGLSFLFAFSRGALAGLCAALLLMLWTLSRRRLTSKALLPLVVLAALVLGGSIFFGTGALEQRLEDIRLMDEREELSLRFRWLTWLGTLPMIARYFWFGSGPGTFEHLFLAFRPSGLFAMRPVYTHNDPLQLAAECGVFAFLACAALTLAFFRNGFRILGRDDSRLRAGVGSGVLAGLSGLLVHGLVDFNFHIPANWLLSAVAAGLLFSMDEDRAYQSKVASNTLRMAVSIILPVLLAACVYLGISDLHLRHAKSSLKKGKMQQAFLAAQNSLRIDPFSADAYYLRALARPDGEKAEALKDLEEAMRRNPYEPVYDLAKARLLAAEMAEHAPSELVDLLESAMAKDPKNPRLAFLAAKITFGNNRVLRDKAGQMLSKNPEQLAGLVDYLEKSGLWQFHRPYHLKLNKADPDALKRDSPSDLWSRAPYAVFAFSDKEGLLFKNTTIIKKIEVRKPLVRMVLRAKGSAAKGVYPVIYVRIDGKLMDEYYVDYPSQKNYFTDLNLAPGEHELSLEYVNDLKAGASSSEDRNVWVQSIQLLEA